MKTFLKPLFLSAAALIALNAGAQTNEENKPEEKPGKKHIKIVQIEDGVTTKVDTIISGDDQFIWNCEDFSDEFFRDGQGGLPPEFSDSLMHKRMKHFRFEGQPGDKGLRTGMRVFKGPREFHNIREFKFEEGDSTRHMIVIKHGEGDEEFMHFRGQGMPAPPRPENMMSHERMQDPNIINLNDPGVISFKKKDLSGGREKIEIIRQKPDKKKVDIEKEVIVDDANAK
ncbi:hypothetical protein [Mangrovibacterium lignilyticum]|uniref:hypothetical protein n=1 Tax=Mangrovibacterium lignilyticum TaxID=2668052 RepID=UPI0013D21B17|nr:hypothetical protein [Mangrovibacterium lignilyticum]